MNNILAYQILNHIKNDVIGFIDIRNGVKAYPDFFNLKDQEFSDTINELLELECIHPLTGGHPKHYKLNQSKNCLEYFEKAKKKQEETLQENEELKKLTLENLRLSKKVAELQIVDFKTKLIYTVLGFILGAIAGKLLEANL